MIKFCSSLVLICAANGLVNPSTGFHNKLATPMTSARNFGNRRLSALQMAVYSSAEGVPAALVEERDACGVGFIASLNNKPSHSTMKQAVQALTCMEHRGATSADNISGDGAGIMSAIPWKLFSSYCDPTKVVNGDGSTGCAVGMLFLPKTDPLLTKHIDIVNDVLTKNGFEVLGFRDVPVDTSVLGELSLQFVPVLRQVVLRGGTSASHGTKSGFATSKDIEKALYDARREIHGRFRQSDFDFTNAYVASLSSKTIIYKGMLRSADLALFYKDLSDENYESAFAIYHRRFSTNTVPKWFLAQPMRLLAHNGEINTLLGNMNWMKSREIVSRGTKKLTGEALRLAGPLVDVTRSDSANLDSVLEFFIRSGRSPEEAIMTLVPEAYVSQPRMTSSVRDFYRYHEGLQEAWDGPALLVFSDGNTVGAALDRNGLRPARFMVTADKHGDKTVHVMSEVGVTKTLNMFAENENAPDGAVLLDSGRLGPGEMLAVDLERGKLRLNDEVKGEMAERRPYGKWADEATNTIPHKPFATEVKRFQLEYGGITSTETSVSAPLTDQTDNSKLLEMQTVFGWGSEDVEQQIASMASAAIESTFCMGDDAPLAALSVMPHTLYDYFKQRFAQVTNPPIDPLREGAVMSLSMFLGPRGDPVSDVGQKTTRIQIDSPLMNWDELELLKTQNGANVVTVSTLYPLYDALSVGGLGKQIEHVCAQAMEAVRNGATIINL
eukprot:gene9114-18882_t